MNFEGTLFNVDPDVTYFSHAILSVKMGVGKCTCGNLKGGSDLMFAYIRMEVLQMAPVFLTCCRKQHHCQLSCC